MAFFEWEAISLNQLKMETYSYGFTRVWERFQWMYVKIIRSLPLQMPLDLYFGQSWSTINFVADS